MDCIRANSWIEVSRLALDRQNLSFVSSISLRANKWYRCGCASTLSHK
jgi:hypothetical protein